MARRAGRARLSAKGALNVAQPSSLLDGGRASSILTSMYDLIFVVNRGGRAR